MADISFLENTISKIKAELGKFMLNQDKLIKLNNVAENFKSSKPQFYDEANKTITNLLQTQKDIEKKATDWVLRASDFKDKLILDTNVYKLLTGNIDLDLLTSNVYSKLPTIISDISNFASEGLKLSQQMLIQNQKVDNINKGIYKGDLNIDLSTSVKQNSSILIYGLIGVLIFLFLMRKK